jgi:uncharacterized protein (TIGR02271 family)
MMKRFNINPRTCTVVIAGASTLLLAAGCNTTEHRHYSYMRSSPAPIVSSEGGTGANYQSTTYNQNENASVDQAGKNVVIPLYQESVNVGKREVDAGTVRLRKVVTTETVNQPVQIRRESVVIEREPGTGQPVQNDQQANQGSGQPFQEQETVIRLQSEVPVIEKQVVPAGRVVAQTRVEMQQTNIQSQIRREDIDVSKSGNAQNVIIGQGINASGQNNQQNSSGAANEPSGQNSGSANESTERNKNP